MSQQHEQFEEESRGEPSYQIGYSPRDEVPPLSSDCTDLPGQKLQAGDPGAATSTPHYLDRIRAVLALLSTSTPHYRDRVRAVLALLSLIMVFVLVIVVIANKLASFIDLFFVVLFGILAIAINLIFAYGGNASPRKASKPEE
jgi:hypothetical protein